MWTTVCQDMLKIHVRGVPMESYCRFAILPARNQATPWATAYVLVLLQGYINLQILQGKHYHHGGMAKNDVRQFLHLPINAHF